MLFGHFHQSSWVFLWALIVIPSSWVVCKSAIFSILWAIIIIFFDYDLFIYFHVFRYLVILLRYSLTIIESIWNHIENKITFQYKTNILFQNCIKTLENTILLAFFITLEQNKWRKCFYLVQYRNPHQILDRLNESNSCKLKLKKPFSKSKITSLPLPSHIKIPILTLKNHPKNLSLIKQEIKESLAS